MSRFVLSFRSSTAQEADPSEEAAWGDWFASIGDSMVERSLPVGATWRGDHC